MGDKASGEKPVATSSRLHNRMVDSMNRHEQQLRLGEGGRGLPWNIPPHLVKAQNLTGSDLVRGAVIDLGDNLLSTSDPLDAEHLWYEGETLAGGRFAVCKRALPSTDIGDVQIFGACLARVNVTNVDHKRAFPKIGQAYFESSHLGPVEILSLTGTPGTGVQVCAVMLRSPQGTVRGIAVDTLSHGTAGTVNLVKLRSGIHSYQRNGSGAHLTVEAYAFVLNSADTIAANTAVTLSMDEAGNINADNANCEASDWLNELDTTASTPGELAGGQAAAQLPPDNNAAAADAIAGNQDFGAIGGPNLWQV